jgi:hypothetical protein
VLIAKQILLGETQEYGDLTKQVKSLKTALFRSEPPAGSVMFRRLGYVLGYQ